LRKSGLNVRKLTGTGLTAQLEHHFQGARQTGCVE
jgi:hypothetical protein